MVNPTSIPNPDNVNTVLGALLMDSFTLKECRKSAEAQAASEASDARKKGDKITPEDIEVRTVFLSGAHLRRRAHHMARGIEAFDRELAEEILAKEEAAKKKAEEERAKAAAEIPPCVAAPPAEGTPS